MPIEITVAKTRVPDAISPAKNGLPNLDSETYCDYYGCGRRFRMRDGVTFEFIYDTSFDEDSDEDTEEDLWNIPAVLIRVFCCSKKCLLAGMTPIGKA